jgi:hypothetical protein
VHPGQRFSRTDGPDSGSRFVPRELQGHTETLGTFLSSYVFMCLQNRPLVRLYQIHLPPNSSQVSSPILDSLYKHSVQIDLLSLFSFPFVFHMLASSSYLQSFGLCQILAKSCFRDPDLVISFTHLSSLLFFLGGDWDRKGESSRLLPDFCPHLPLKPLLHHQPPVSSSADVMPRHGLLT